MSKTIAIVNQKGGVGKTTTTVNLGIGLASEGKRVLLIDSDAQGNLTESLGFHNPDNMETTLATIMQKIVEEKPLAENEGILHHCEGVDLLSANIELSGMETVLVNTMSRERILKDYINQIKDKYDYILIDCTPSLGMLTVNALTAADEVIVPVQAHFLPAKGLEQLMKTVAKVRRNINPNLKIGGILLTMVDGRVNLSKQIAQVIREAYGRKANIYDTNIPFSIKAAETSAAGKSIFQYDKNGKVINAVSFVDGKKYRCSFKDYFIDIRGISDQICREHCLSVIDNPSHSGMHYAEWKALNEGKPTIRGRMRAELDEIISASYSVKEFWRALERNGYVIHRKGENISHTSIIPPFGKRSIRLDSLGKDYTEDAIAERIRAARNGIWLTPPSQIRRTYRVRGNLRNYKRKKLKGFKALYFRYLYMFGKVKKRQTPKKVSFFLRDELVKFERYKKQMLFLYDNDIETAEQLERHRQIQQEEIAELTEERKALYAKRTAPEAAENAAARIAEINIELRALRADVRMCNLVMVDAERIAERQIQLEELRKQEEVKRDDTKRRGR